MEKNVDAYKTTEFSEWSEKDEINSVEDFILRSLDGNKSVLDAGTGGGRFLHALKSRGLNLLTGFDYLEEFIEIAKKRDVSGTIKFDVADAKRLPYKNEQFDQCLYLQQVLCLIEDKEGRISALRELQRTMKRNGVAYISLLLKESREKTPPGFLLKCYLRIFRKFLHRNISLSLQPWLQHGGCFNWSCFLDAPPYIYWYSLKEAIEDITSVGLVVHGIASDNQLTEGRWLNSDSIRGNEIFKGVLYIKCGKK